MIPERQRQKQKFISLNKSGSRSGATAVRRGARARAFPGHARLKDARFRYVVGAPTRAHPPPTHARLAGSRKIKTENVLTGSMPRGLYSRWRVNVCLLEAAACVCGVFQGGQPGKRFQGRPKGLSLSLLNHASHAFRFHLSHANSSKYLACNCTNENEGYYSGH